MAIATVEAEFDGGTYLGEWKDGMPNGKGTHKVTSSDGTADWTYVGQWKDGKRSGTGEKVYVSRKPAYTSSYTGEWLDNLENGQGTETYINPPNSSSVWTGNFKNGKRHGRATEYFRGQNAWSLTGEWINGLKQGEFIVVDSYGQRIWVMKDDVKLD